MSLLLCLTAQILHFDAHSELNMTFGYRGSPLLILTILITRKCILRWILIFTHFDINQKSSER